MSAEWLCVLPALPVIAWGALALAYQLPVRGGARVLGVLLWFVLWLAIAAGVRAGTWPVALAAALLASVALLAWWRTIRPTNDRLWSDEVAQLLEGRSDGDCLTLQQVRNFDWHSRSEYLVRWETRQYLLSELRTVDVLLSHWMGPLIAHTLVSFGFADGRYLAFSIEIRKQRGELFSSLGGFFRKYEMTLVAGDERDLVRLRANVRGEQVDLYRVTLPPAAMRALLLAYLDEAKALRRQPRWYNTATANCTTVVFEMMRRIVGHLPLDYRLLLSGKLPEYLYAVGALAPGHTLAELRAAARITERAAAADQTEDFSQRIRAGVPGIPSSQS